MKIDFMCVGVQKAGTSTLHDIIKQHPDVELPFYKETQFFCEDRKYEKGLNYYFDYFFKNKQTQFIGEITPEYSYFDFCANRIFDAFGHIKIIFIIRNPVDRAYSHYLMTKRRGLESLSFKEALEQEPNRLTSYNNKVNFSYIDRGRYNLQIKRFQQIFGIENIKVILFDDFTSNTSSVVNEIADFINLPLFEYDFDVKSNTVSEPKSKFIRDFIHKPNNLKKTVGSLIPSKKIKDYVMINLNKKNLKPSKKEALEPELKKEIYNTYFVEEIKLLETNFGFNLEHWKYL